MARIAKLGSLSADVTPHVLRHSFASLADDLGYCEPTITALIGHKRHSITSRYVHPLMRYRSQRPMRWRTGRSS